MQVNLVDEALFVNINMYNSNLTLLMVVEGEEEVFKKKIKIKIKKVRPDC